MNPNREAFLYPFTATRAVLRGVAWVARLLARLHTPEECLKRKVHPHANILQGLGIDLFQERVFCFPAGQQLDGIVQGKRFLSRFPRLPANVERFVVDPRADSPRAVKCRALGRGREKAVLKGQSHIPIIAGLCDRNEHTNREFSTMSHNAARFISPLKEGVFARCFYNTSPRQVR